VWTDHFCGTFTTITYLLHWLYDFSPACAKVKKKKPHNQSWCECVFECVPAIVRAQSRIMFLFSLLVRMLSHATSEHLRATAECRSNRDQLPAGHGLLRGIPTIIYNTHKGTFVVWSANVCPPVRRYLVDEMLSILNQQRQITRWPVIIVWPPHAH